MHSGIGDFGQYSVEVVMKTLLFAIRAHGDQKRKMSGEPYICHPIRVAHRLLDAEISPVAAFQAAILHDVLEDTATTFEELEANFGKTVAELVKELTNDKILIGSLGKTQYLHDKLPQLSMSALLIKLCDRYDNIHDLPPAATQNEWATKYAQQTFHILRDLPFRSVSQSQLVDDIKKRLNELGYVQF